MNICGVIENYVDVVHSPELTDYNVVDFKNPSTAFALKGPADQLWKIQSALVLSVFKHVAEIKNVSPNPKSTLNLLWKTFPEYRNDSWVDQYGQRDFIEIRVRLSVWIT